MMVLNSSIMGSSWGIISVEETLCSNCPAIQPVTRVRAMIISRDHHGRFTVNSAMAANIRFRIYFPSFR